VRNALFVILGFGILGSTALGAPQFPYKAFVNADEVYVRSGPGEDYYPTDKLRLGQEVEVYRHDPGGWFAVRPPEGSFTWVSARYLDSSKRGVSRVTGEGVAARVGSRFSDIRDVIQVRLNKGEEVEVLETKTATDKHGEKGVWCRIAPPAGEFRWVSGKYVDPEFPRDGARKASAAEGMTTAAPMIVAQPGLREPPPRPLHRPPERHPVHVSSAAPPPVGPEPEFAAMPMRNLSPEGFIEEAENLELDRSIMLAEETTVWSFENLRPRAEGLAQQAQTAVERGRARLLLNKIARFEDIKRRYDEVNQLSGDIERRNNQLASLSRARAEASRPATRLEDRYDGVGRLTPVASPPPGAPRYALVQPNGEVRCYVSPAPGVNLQSYVGREVGVSGVRGYMPEQRASHVMAKHINALDSEKLR